MPQQNWHHFLLQSNKASWKVNVLVKFCGWRQEIIEPYEKTAGSRMKTLQRKTWTVTMKIFIQHIIKLAFERSPPQNFAVGRERGSYRYPAHRHCLPLSGSDGGWSEALRHPSSLPGKMNRGRARPLSFRFILVLAECEPFGSCSHHALWGQVALPLQESAFSGLSFC